jgi:hypothetical protein
VWCKCVFVYEQMLQLYPDERCKKKSMQKLIKVCKSYVVVLRGGLVHYSTEHDYQLYESFI